MRNLLQECAKYTVNKYTYHIRTIRKTQRYNGRTERKLLLFGDVGCVEGASVVVVVVGGGAVLVATGFLVI